jgi:hypothetical protein
MLFVQLLLTLSYVVEDLILERAIGEPFGAAARLSERPH